MTVNVFDVNYYRNLNPDLTAAGLTTDAQLVNHFVNSGVNEGRRFSAFVNLDFYRASNQDLVAAGFNNLQSFYHLQSYGIAEGRTFSYGFNPSFYRAANADLVAAGLTTNEQLFDHFRNFGVNEGRASATNFNVRYYLDANPDLKAAGFNYAQAFQHYVNYGIREGRPAAPGGGTTTPPPAAAVDPGNSMNQALDIGALSGTATFNQFVGTSDPNDFYRFTLPSNSSFSASLTGLTQNLDVEIVQDYNNNNIIDSDEVLYYSRSSATETDFINSDLQRGTYFARVTQGSQGFGSGSSNYTLQLSATAKGTLPVDPPNVMSQALNIDTLTGTRTFSDFVGKNDIRDYYRFSLSTPRNVSLSLTGLTSNLDLEIVQDFNNNDLVDSGEILYGSYRSGTETDLINATLQAGSYLVRLTPGSVGFDYGSSNYTLTLSA